MELFSSTALGLPAKIPGDAAASAAILRGATEAPYKVDYLIASRIPPGLVIRSI